MKSKILILLAALLLASVTFISCNSSGTGSAGTSGSVSDEEQTTTESGATSDAPVNIIENNLTEYKIIRPDLTSEAVQNAAINLKNVLNEQYSISIPILTDFEGRNFNVADRYKYEIIVGNTNRDESISAIESLRYDDFIITLSGTRVVITGGNDEATAKAVDYFIENYVKGDVLTVSTNMARVNGTYSRENVKIGGIDLSDYTIVYNGDFKSGAQTAASKLGSTTGAIINLQSESKKDSEHTIFLGSKKFSLEFFDGLGVDDFKIVTKDGNIHIVGGSDYAVNTALKRFIDFVATDATSSDISFESCSLSYTLPDRDEYINDISKLALHWELEFDVPEWMLDFDEKYKAINDGNGRLMSCLHRGEMVYYPENSIEGVISAIMMGADMIEIDPRKTKDGVLILMHDDTLIRTTNVSEFLGKNGFPSSSNVCDWTYDQLMQLNLKMANGDPTPYKIPKLEEVLKVCANRIFIRLDVKGDDNGVFWNYSKDIWPLQEKYKSYYNVIYTWHSAFTSSSYKLVKDYNKKQKELCGKTAPFFIGSGASTNANSVISTIKSIGSSKTVRLTDFDLKTVSAEEYLTKNAAKLKTYKDAGIRVYVDAHRNESIELYETLYKGGIDLQLTNKGLALCKYIAENFSATK